MLNVRRIRTTAWEEEDFYLLSDLSDSEIKKVMTDMVAYEREHDKFYDFEDYLHSLRMAYPNNVIRLYHDIDLLIF